MLLYYNAINVPQWYDVQVSPDAALKALHGIKMTQRCLIGKQMPVQQMSEPLIRLIK